MNDRAGVRTIDAGTPPSQVRARLALPGPGRQVPRLGGPHAVEAFGTKLVVFADSAGKLHVLDAFCRHMGGDLTRGTIKGDAGRLPVPRLALGRERQVRAGSRTPGACRRPRGPGPG